MNMGNRELEELGVVVCLYCFHSGLNREGCLTVGLMSFVGVNDYHNG